MDEYRCKICGKLLYSKVNGPNHISDRNDKPHDVEDESEHVTHEDVDVSRETLEALYVVNKCAKRRSDSATQAYNRGETVEAKRYSKQKTKLYEIKWDILFHLQKVSSSIEIHDINGRSYYCLFFEEYSKDKEWSFHVPTDKIDIHEDVETNKSIEYQRTVDMDKSRISLQEALTNLEYHLIPNFDRFDLQSKF